MERAVRYLGKVVTLTFAVEKCDGCGRCWEVCPQAVFAPEAGGRKARITDRDSCIECGACAVNCVPAAIGVRSGVGCASAVMRGAGRGTAPGCG
jgi:NAD-dependent dihydropyrimidine dehydrogenase PreA subunit